MVIVISIFYLQAKGYISKSFKFTGEGAIVDMQDSVENLLFTSLLAANAFLSGRKTVGGVMKS